MKKLIIAMLLCMVGIGFAGCSSDNNDDEPSEQYTYQKVKGRWYVTAYLNSDNYFTAFNDGSYFEFGQSGYIYHDGTTNEDETGRFAFDEQTNRAKLQPSKGEEWDLVVTFETADKATFKMVGMTHRQTFKVERQSGK